MPANHGLRLDDHERRWPAIPEPRQPHPEDPVRRLQPRTLRGAPIRCQLLAEGEVLEQKSLLPHEERPNRGPNDGAQERRPPNLAEDENINDIKRDGVFADYGGKKDDRTVH